MATVGKHIAHDSTGLAATNVYVCVCVLMPAGSAPWSMLLQLLLAAIGAAALAGGNAAAAAAAAGALPCAASRELPRAMCCSLCGPQARLGVQGLEQDAAGATGQRLMLGGRSCARACPAELL